MFNFFKRSSPPKPKQRRTPVIKLSPHQRGLFSAADYDRNNATWDAQATPIGQMIDLKLPTLVARSREQISNNDYARGFVREVRKGVLGHKGIILQCRSQKPNGELDLNINACLEKFWRMWGRRENCTIDGRLDWVRVQKIIVNTVVGSGEIFIRIVEGEHAGEWGFSVQLLDPLRVPIRMNNKRLKNGNIIRNGIEMNPFGRPVAYYIETGAGILADPFRYEGKEFERVQADNVLHIYDQEHPEQFRGIPWNHTSLKRMKNLGAFEEASVINARAAASKTMVLKPDPDVYEVENDDEDEGYEEPEILLEANTVVTLPPGYEPANYTPDFPSSETSSFSKLQLRGMSTGQGVAYNSLSNDLEGVNFSSIRQGKLDERDGWKEIQDWFIEAVCHPIYERWLEYSLLAGLIYTDKGKPLQASKYQKLSIVEWQARRWEWVDPLKEEKAVTEAVSNGRKALSESIRESGRDPIDVWRAYAADIKSMQSQGIPNEFINQILGIKPEVKQGVPTDEGEEETES